MAGVIPVKVRRPSISLGEGPAGKRFKEILKSVEGTYGSGPKYREDLNEFMDTFIKFTRSGDTFGGMFVQDKTKEFASEVQLNGNTYVTVGLIALFSDPNPVTRGAFGHAVPYVRMNGDWYKGDNEKGFLEFRTNGPPSWDTTYPPDWTIESMYYFYIKKSELERIMPTRIQIPLPHTKFSGRVTFKQSEAACWSDSIQSVLMNSDGYRDVFMDFYTDVFFGADCRSILEFPANLDCRAVLTSEAYLNHLALNTEEVNKYKYRILNNITLKVATLFGIKPTDTPTTLEIKVFNLIGLTFFRMLSWGMVPWNHGPFIEHVVGRTGAHHPIRPNNSIGIYSKKPPTSMNVNVASPIKSPIKMNIGGYKRHTRSRSRR